jgi:hypothetical protein
MPNTEYDIFVVFIVFNKLKFPLKFLFQISPLNEQNVYVCVNASIIYYLKDDLR